MAIPTQRWKLHRVRWGWLLCVASAAVGLSAVSDGDIFWHLAAGREMLRTGALLERDSFSIGAAGRSWIDLHWLFQLAAYGVHQLFGLRGLVLTKCALLGVSASIFYAASARSARLLTGLILLGALVCARQLLLVRPVIVSVLLLALCFLQLERYRRHGSARALWPLPLAQIVWSNCQGLFALGPALIGAYCLGQLAWVGMGRHASYPFAPECAAPEPASQPARVRALLACLGCTLLASLVTPFGVRALGLPFGLLGRLAPRDDNPFRQVAENVPPFVLERLSPGEFWHLKWFLGGLALAFALRRGRVLLSHALVLAGFVGLALISNRNVLLLYCMAAPLAARQLVVPMRLLRSRLRQASIARARAWVPVAVFALLVASVGVAVAREPSLARPTPFHFPVASARVIASDAGSGAIFAADHQGGYLIWALHPRFRPWFDTRWILRTAAEFSDYLALSDDPPRFDAFAARHALAYVVLPVAYPSRYLGLIAHLYRSPRWQLIFTDGSEVLFAPRSLTAPGIELGDPRTIDRLLLELERAWPEPRLREAARLQLATLSLAVGEPGQAERALVGLRSEAARSLGAHTRLLAGDVDTAAQLAQQLLAAEPESVRALTLLAGVCAQRGQLTEALGQLRRALALDPYDRAALNLLHKLENPSDAD